MIASDNDGGAIIVWHDNRTLSTGWDIYAQRIDATGTPQWGANGIAICNVTGTQNNPTLVGDGLGGAIITWQDSRSTGIYAQKVNGGGQVQWTANGVPICIATGTQNNPTLVGDGFGGAIITWQDSRSTGIYAQKVNGDGQVQWTANGVAVCVAANTQGNPMLIGDGSGGAIIVWQDPRVSTANYGIYAQRLNGSGVPQWTTDGVAVCNDANNQLNPVLVSDGSGGAVITWHDYRRGTSNSGIYAQRLSSSGVPQWADNGTAVCNDTRNQQYPQLVSDGPGGAIIAWQDYRLGTSNSGIYAQRVSGSGIPLWTDNGTVVCSAANNQWYPTMVGDSSGGAVIAWQDYRLSTSNSGIYAQRVSGSGIPQWTDNGTVVCSAANNQWYPTMAGISSGGAIIIWQDQRGNGTNYDVYAQKVKGNGSLPIPPTATNVSPGLGDQGQTLGSVIVAGANFIDGSTSLSFGSGITVSGLSVDSTTQVTASIEIDPAASPGARDITVSTPDGTAVMSGGFTVYPVPVAGFTVDKTAVVVGEAVTFFNSSHDGAPPLSYEWDFDGDSTWDSLLESPVWVYSAAGTYTVILRVTDQAGVPVTKTEVDCVTVDDALQADFNADRMEVVAGQVVSFTDLSAGGIPALSYQWDFDNDAEWDSTAQNPTHAYSAPGTYSVVLRVTDSAAHSSTKTDNIAVFDTLNADFAADRTTAVAGQSIQFTDTSVGGVIPLAWLWDFGDAAISTAQNPSHAYADPGTYTVVLQITDSAENSDIATRDAYITISPSLQADFTADDTLVTSGQDVHFTSTSSGGVTPISHEWDFGDSSTSGEENPTHAYASSGVYTVTLRVTDSADNEVTRTRAGYVAVVSSCGDTVSAAGTGTVEICSSAGTVQNLRSVTVSSVPQSGKPLLAFNHGLFAFEVSGLSAGDSTTLTITLPSATPATTQYWKYGPTAAAPGGEWYSVQMGSNDGDNVITITLTDGGVGDDDLTANGTIVDQGGPATPHPPEPAPAFPSVYFGLTVALGAGAMAYLIRRRLTGR